MSAVYQTELHVWTLTRPLDAAPIQFPNFYRRLTFGSIDKCRVQMACLTDTFGSDKYAFKTSATETSQNLFNSVKQKRIVLV
jgi:hypothetical protein